MGLEKGVASEEFYQDASDTPYVAWVAPSQVEDYFRRSVMPGRDYGRVVFVIKRCGPKIDQPDLCIQEDFTLASSASYCGRGGGNPATVREGLISAVDQKDVFWLEVRVD